MAAMREHLEACKRCARRDAQVRRSLLLLKNLPAIEVSDGFQDRLRQRLSAEQQSRHATPVARSYRAARWSAAAALFAGVVALTRWQGTEVIHEPLRLPAVTAVAPLDAFGDGDSSPAYVASMSTGIPMWPALMMAEEGPLRFAGMQNASWENARPND